MVAQTTVVITGAGGQLGGELLRAAPEEVQCVPLGSADLDITDAGRTRERIIGARPDIVINAAAYTAVDRAETDAGRAYAVNADGPGNLAAAVRECGAFLVHVSTDFVFDGRKSSPYHVDDTPCPTGVYGASKLEGERRIAALLPAERHAVVRTAWVYSCHGRNFVKTMLRLMAERQSLGVVADQIGTPTWAKGLALAVWQVALERLNGTHHWTDAGVASWYDFAVAIMEEARDVGLLRRDVCLTPLRTEEYPTPARRPAYSVLDKTLLWKKLGAPAPHWRVSLRRMLHELKKKER